jgi:acetoin:2,6-dichlorophenolindophenol oxidoreductase subunit alpha
VREIVMIHETGEREANLDRAILPVLLTTMMRIRAFESRVEELFFAGKIAGSVHLYIGEEATAVGVCGALQPTDYITSTHRGHGHAIAKGARLDRMMAELFGRRTGYCKGKGGSMHIADFSVGMLGANGIVGGGFSIAVGAGMSAKMRGSGQVAVAFFGDGASSRGTFHEALNMAAVYRLPVLFVNENNQYASTTPSSYGVAVKDVADRAAGYGIPGVVVDGNDLFAVREAALEAAARARAGDGPTLLECKTYRWRGHYIGDPEQYRDKSEVAQWRERCPIRRLQAELLSRGVIRQEEIAEISQRIDREVEAAVQFAEESPLPDPDEALNDLFANPTGVLQ